MGPRVAVGRLIHFPDTRATCKSLGAERAKDEGKVLEVGISHILSLLSCQFTLVESAFIICSIVYLVIHMKECKPALHPVFLRKPDARLHHHGNGKTFEEFQAEFSNLSQSQSILSYFLPCSYKLQQHLKILFNRRLERIHPGNQLQAQRCEAD